MNIKENKIIQNIDNSIILDTNIDTRGFAQAHLSSFIDEKGWLAKFNQSQNDFTFEPWYFYGTQEAKNGSIQLIGKFQSGKTLLSIIEENEKNARINESLKTIQLVIGAMESALQKDIELPLSGPEGTIIADTGEILFLPQNLFERSAISRTLEEYSSILGCWINPGLDKKEGQLFTEAVYVYRVLSGKMPFANVSTEQRHEDYFDHNFVPIELLVPGINKKLAYIVNTNLNRQGAIRISKNKTSVRVQDTTLRCKNIPTELITMNEDISEEEIQKTKLNCKKFIKKQNNHIRKIRFIRNHNTILKVATGILIVLALMTTVFISDKQKEYTSIGLTSSQTCNVLYTGIANLDIPLLQAVCKGKETDWLIDSISTLYVTQKMRQTHEQGIMAFTLAEWLYMNEDKFLFSGITNLYLNNQPISTNFYPYIRKDKPLPVTEENNVMLQKGDIKIFTSNYDYVNAKGDGIISIEKCTDNITVQYQKNTWKIISIERNSNVYQESLDKFQNAYKEALIKSEGSVKKAIKEIRSIYPWLPDQEELQKAAEEMFTRFGAISAAYDLSN